MNDAVETAFETFVQTAVAADANFQLPPPNTVNWYTSGSAETVSTPWTGFEMLSSDPLHADTAVSKGQLKVTLESQTDDETEETHDARVSAVAAALRDWRAVSQAITDAGAIRVFGFSLMTRRRRVEDKHRTSELLYNVGFVPLA